MAATLLSDISAYLAAEGVGTVWTGSAGDIFEAKRPDEPDKCLTVYRGGGGGIERAIGVDGIARERPNIQIICRGERGDSDAPQQMAEDAYVALGGVQAETLSGTVYLMISPLQSPFPMGDDEDGRPLIVFNCSVWKELS